MRKKISITEVDFGLPDSILQYAKELEGMTFQDVLDLGIEPAEQPTDGARVKQYNARNYRGGMGNLLEEHYFGYRANSSQLPDFVEADIELKSTCFDRRGDDIRAGERLVLSMIPFDAPVEKDLESSHFWEKNSRILLVWYERDKTIDRLDQHIRYVNMFTPSPTDMLVIREDYRLISSLIRQGRADELSEGMTNYLGACTKGDTAANSWRVQFYEAPDGSRKLAKRRAWCFKQSYMNKVLHEYVLGEHDDAEDALTAADLAQSTFEKAFMSKIEPYIDMTDKAIAEKLGITYDGGKAQWINLAYRMMGVRSNRAAELEKANVTVRAVRREQSGKIVEAKPLCTVDFLKLAEETWEESELHALCDENRFFYVVFRREDDGEYHLAGSAFWSMPAHDIESGVRACWQKAKDALEHGVELVPTSRGITNNLPGMADGGGICHLRPRAQKAAYRFEDSTEVGNVARDASPLPDGRWMTTQAVWLNPKYMESVLDGLGL